MKKTNINKRYLFKEDYNSNFSQLLENHSKVISILDSLNSCSLVNDFITLVIFPDREYYWVGTEILGPPADLYHENIFFYDTFDMTVLKFNQNFKENIMGIDDFHRIFQNLAIKYKDKINNSLYQVNFKVSDNKFHCEFLVFYSI